MPVLIDITPADLWETLKSIKSGDGLNQATFLAVNQRFANALQHLYNRVVGENGSHWVDAPMWPPLDAPAFAYQPLGTKMWVEDGSAGGSFGQWLLPLPKSDKWQIAELRVMSRGVNHGGQWPQSRPKVALWRIEPQSGLNPVKVAEFTDMSNAMDTMHVWGGVLATSESLGHDRWHMLSITGESGSNAQPDHQYHMLSVRIEPR